MPKTCTLLASLTVFIAMVCGPSVSLAAEPVPDATVGGLRRLPVLRESETIKPTGRTVDITLTARVAHWRLVKGASIMAYTFDGKVPGPVIDVTEGDLVRVTVVNKLPEPTSVHWHGLHLTNPNDGIPPFTQKPIQPGESFTYEFLAPHAGTYMYHSHWNSIQQVDKGLYGMLIIRPQDKGLEPVFDLDLTMMLSGWIIGDGMPGMGMSMNYDYWTINGKAYPETQGLVVKKGQWVRVRFANISNALHPMHLHGMDFRVIAEDGHPLDYVRIINTLDIAPGKTFDIAFLAENTGTWLLHCHELHHTANGETEPGGLMMEVKVVE